MSIPLVLIPDDDTLVATSMVRTARSAGWRAFSDTGSRALDLAARYHPDVVLLDVQQPVDGRRLLTQLKRDERTRHIRVVMVSGAMDDEMRSSCLKLGAAECVAKPFPSTLFEQLAREVRQEPRALAPSESPEAAKRRVVVFAPSAQLTGLGGHEVVRVDSAEAALRACSAQRTHVLVCEEPNGVALVLRARETDASLRGVVIAHASQYLAASRLDPSCGCQMLLKPYSPERIAEAVTRAARQSWGRSPMAYKI